MIADPPPGVSVTARHLWEVLAAYRSEGLPRPADAVLAQRMHVPVAAVRRAAAELDAAAKEGR